VVGATAIYLRVDMVISDSVLTTIITSITTIVCVMVSGRKTRQSVESVHTDVKTVKDVQAAGVTSSEYAAMTPLLGAIAQEPEVQRANRRPTGG
jgi:hypothetical protein